MCGRFFATRRGCTCHIEHAVSEHAANALNAYQWNRDNQHLHEWSDIKIEWSIRWQKGDFATAMAMRGQDPRAIGRLQQATPRCAS